MWIFNTDGFFSISISIKDQNLIQVRARKKHDLKNAANNIDPNLKIHEYSGSDYRYRIYITRKQLEDYMVFTAKNIDYSNFKNAVHKKDMEEEMDKKLLDEKMDSYFNVWRIMHRYQEMEV
ncbi:MAG: hypothetical protein RBR08_06900 [Desulforegulaceae bacterium]|jgi:hypothetical protein|nr:hypothetical protein [Desulforegulaceae bacterium]